MSQTNIKYGIFTFLTCIGLYLFCRGFFLHRNLLTVNSQCHDKMDFYQITTNKACWSDSKFNRTVILVVDALKYEFTTWSDEFSAHWANKMPVFEDFKVRLFCHIIGTCASTFDRLDEFLQLSFCHWSIMIGDLVIDDW